jgi:nucleoside-diphosphate-sugar epimerase
VTRVLVTGGAGSIGSANVRRLLRDPDFEVRVSDRRPAPVWMRESAEVHAGDLRLLDEARKALRGCTHVIHLAAFHDESQPFTLLDVNMTLHTTVLRAALDAEVERCTFVSGDGGAADDSPRAFAAHAGEILCRAARDEHGLRFTICRPYGVYGPGLEHLVMDLLRAARLGEPLAADAETPVPCVYVDDVADAIVRATAAPETLNETFAISAAEPLRSLGEACWAACGNAPGALRLTPPAEPLPEALDPVALERAIGWRSAVAPADGIARSLASLDHIPGGS